VEARSEGKTTRGDIFKTSKFQSGERDCGVVAGRVHTFDLQKKKSGVHRNFMEKNRGSIVSKKNKKKEG